MPINLTSGLKVRVCCRHDRFSTSSQQMCDTGSHWHYPAPPTRRLPVERSARRAAPRRQADALRTTRQVLSMTQTSSSNGHAAVSIGLMLHLAPETQIYCELYGNQPPALVIGAEPADCVISSANFEADPVDLIAADRLV